MLAVVPYGGAAQLKAVPFLCASLRLPGRARSWRTFRVGNLAPASPSTCPRLSRVVVASQKGDSDFAVMRFTLGIPGFDDALLPRLVGGVGLVLLVLNSALSAAATNSGQGRAEALGAVLGALCIAVPSLNARLQEASPARGRKGSPDQLAGATQVFCLADELSEAQKQELAWASYVLLKNVNAVGLAVLLGDQLLAVRGSIAAAVCEQGKDAASISKALQPMQPSTETPAYMSDRAAISKSAKKLQFLPDGIESLAVQTAQSSESRKSLRLLVWSDAPRALPPRDRQWIKALAEKLSGFF